MGEPFFNCGAIMRYIHFKNLHSILITNRLNMLMLAYFNEQHCHMQWWH